MKNQVSEIPVNIIRHDIDHGAFGGDTPEIVTLFVQLREFRRFVHRERRVAEDIDRIREYPAISFIPENGGAAYGNEVACSKNGVGAEDNERSGGVILKDDRPIFVGIETCYLSCHLKAATAWNSAPGISVDFLSGVE